MAKRKATSRNVAKSERLSGKRWQLQAAKAQFSEVVRRARSEGPQWVTKQDREAVVIVQAEEFERLSRARQPESLVEFFRKSPLAELDLRFDRRSDYGRDIEL